MQTKTGGALAGCRCAMFEFHPIPTDKIIVRLKKIALGENLECEDKVYDLLATIVNGGTLTLPTSTDTLVARNTTDTLTNKTIAGGSSGNQVTANKLASATNVLVINTNDAGIEIRFFVLIFFPKTPY